MDNYEAKNIYDAVSLARDIKEREDIIDTFNRYGYLDRDNAIKKILELRGKDPEVLTITSAKLAVTSIPFEQASNQDIVAELEMQMGLLSGKLADIAL